MGATESTIGILGDGQLAMMLGEAAERRRIPFKALGQDSNSSFARRFPNHWLPFSEFDSSANTSWSCLTLENEFHTVEELQKMEQVARSRMIPSPRDFSFFQNKISQRRFFEKLGLPSPLFGVWNPQYPINTLRFPLVLKKPFGGYDGYGVRFVSSEAELKVAATELSSSKNELLLWEEHISIQREFAQGVLLDGRGGWVALPLFETIQENGICVAVMSHSTLLPEKLEQVRQRCLEILSQFAASGLSGLYHFEFFYTQDNRILLNEGAPRPHNSAHLTQDGCESSQFDLLMRFLHQQQLPIPSGTVLSCQPGFMLNLLGTGHPGPYVWTEPTVSPRSLGFVPQVHLYDKLENRKGRKMGHINWMLERPSENAALLLRQAVEMSLQ